MHEYKPTPNEMTLKKNKTQSSIYLLVMFCCVFYVILTLLAMMFYPGGTYLDHAAKGYRFFENFFSDLGFTRVFDGQANTISFILFTVALCFVGMAQALFFISLNSFFTGIKSSRLFSRLGSGFGLISSLSCFGLIFAPANIVYKVHILIVCVLLISFCLASICYAAAIKSDGLYPDFYAVIYLFLSLGTCTYILLLYSGPRVFTPKGIVFHATAQKIIIYAYITCMFFQAYGAYGLTRYGNFFKTSPRAQRQKSRRS